MIINNLIIIMIIIIMQQTSSKWVQDKTWLVWKGDSLGIVWDKNMTILANGICPN